MDIDPPHLVGVHVLHLNPGAGGHLGGDVRLVLVVGLVEPEYDLILLGHGVVDIIMPGPVVLYVPPDHRDEYLVLGRRSTGARGAGAVILCREHLMVGSDVPVVPPTDLKTLHSPAVLLSPHVIEGRQVSAVEILSWRDTETLLRAPVRSCEETEQCEPCLEVDHSKDRKRKDPLSFRTA